VRFGLEIMTTGKKRDSLIAAFEAALRAMGNRVAPFDEAAAAKSALSRSFLPL